MKYIVTDLHENNLEDYEENDTNIMHISVLDCEGKIQQINKFKVCISLSQDGLLALGKELIRLAHRNPPVGRHFHFDRIQKDSAVMSLGVYLHPDSSETILSVNDFDKVSEIQRKL